MIDSDLTRRRFLARTAAAAAGVALGPSIASGADAAAPLGPARPSAPLAMWALTGTLDLDLIRRQLDAMAEVGWGAVLYPRSGLELEYLGEVWFDRIRYIVQQAAARSMELWLYDEFNWPSGQAKGLVAAGRPDLEAQLLEVQADGASRVLRAPGSACLLQREATERFLEVTHERYAAAIGPFFGTTVRAVFTDEPSLPHQHRPKNPADKPSWQVVWSAALDRALGGDFPRRLAQAKDPAGSPLWRDYWAAFAQVFHDAWVDPIAQWCRNHRLALSGHLMSEGSFGGQVAFNGSLRRQLAAFGIPGIDEISTRTEVSNCEAMTLAAIAEFAGRERMVEVYALGPPSMSLDTMCKMVDLCSACGVDRYVLAICPLDLRGGIEKRAYLGIHGVQQPWFRDLARRYTEYVAAAAERARAARPLGVPWPSDEELWAAAGPAPMRSKALGELTGRFIAAAREAIASRLEPRRAPTAAAEPRKPLQARWTFAPAGPNSLRIDRPTLAIVDLPKEAALSVQSQLVRGLTVNGHKVDLGSAPTDNAFDASYRRVSVAEWLRVGENRFEVDSAEAKPLPFLPSLILWGPFTVDAEGRLTAPARSIEPGDWRSQGYPAFCGKGRYRAEIHLDSPPRRLGVDAGGYPVRAVWNGADLGWRIRPPFQFDLGRAGRAGPNEACIEIVSTLGHLLVPDKSPPVGLISAWIE